MNRHLSTCVAAIACLLLASCYPVNENPEQKPAAKQPEKTAAAADAEKLKEQEAARKKDKEKEDLAQEKTPEKTDSSTEPTTSEKPKSSTESKGKSYPVAIRAPGRENCVLSPYNNKLVSTLDDNNKPLPTGTLVQDPSYPASEKKFFRVP